MVLRAVEVLEITVPGVRVLEAEALNLVGTFCLTEFEGDISVSPIVVTIAVRLGEVKFTIPVWRDGTTSIILGILFIKPIPLVL